MKMSCTQQLGASRLCMKRLVAFIFAYWLTRAAGQARTPDWIDSDDGLRSSRCLSADGDRFDREAFLEVVQSCSEDGFFSSRCCDGMNSLFGRQGQLPYCLCEPEVSRLIFTPETGLEVEEGLQACGTPFVGSMTSSPLCEYDTELTLQEALEPDESQGIQLNFLRPDFPERAISVLLPAQPPTLLAGLYIGSIRPQLLLTQERVLTEDKSIGPYVKMHSFSDRYLALAEANGPTSGVVSFSRLDTWRVPSGQYSSEEDWQPHSDSTATTMYSQSMLNPFDVAGKYPRPGSVSILSVVWSDLFVVKSVFQV